MSSAYRSFGMPDSGPGMAIAAGNAVKMLKSGKMADTSLLAYGNGRSYGDSCHNSGGQLVDMRSANRILALDTETGIAEVESGVLLSDLIAHVLPYGFFPAVTPGTQFVTIGGAIANDVHGKNHHRRGTFGCHVESLKLLRSDGKIRTCSAARNSKLFAATIGGMGLTGLIVSARIRLMAVPGADVMERVTPFSCIAEYIDIARQADEANEYAVAWVDQLATGRSLGRGLLLTANHMCDGYGRHGRVGRISVPVTPPFSVLNRPFLKLFNAAFYHRRAHGRPAPRRSSYQKYFYPLDGIANWNRLYGPRGLHQHQSVIPEEVAGEIVPELLAAARTAGHGSFLTVLKRFGDVLSPGVLSFPRPGYTLTLDFPNSGIRTTELMGRLDQITVEAGGAVNPYKDARMAAGVFERSFANWRDLEAQRDPAFMSDFWARTAGQLDAKCGVPAIAAE